MKGTLAARDTATGAEIISVSAVGQVSDLIGDKDAPLPQLLGMVFDHLCVPDLPATVTGTFSSTTVLPWGAHYEETGTATFVRAAPDPAMFAPPTYELSSATMTVTASDPGPVPDCQMTGTKQFDVGPGSGQFLVYPPPPGSNAPYQYAALILLPNPTSMDVTLSSCADPALDGMVTPAQALGGFTIGNAAVSSPDGWVFDGSSTFTQPGGYVYNTTWSFRGQ